MSKAVTAGDFSMRLFLLYFIVGIFLLLLQSTLLHLLPFGPVVPDLVLILCVYLGLYHPSVGSAIGSFLLGYSVDVMSSRLLGLNAFAMTLVFLAVYLSSRSIWLNNPLVSSFIVLLAALIKGAALVLGWAVFLTVDRFWMGAARYIMGDALLAAALAPFLFALLQRGESYVKKFSVGG